MRQINPLVPLYAQLPFIVLDGALATELERRGADLRDPLWSARVLLETPQLIQDVHTDYFAAGADIAISASYQASYAGLARRGLDHAAATALLHQSVDLACAARDAFWSVASNRSGRCYPLVAASVGPYGAVLADGSEYRGNYGLSVQELVAWHEPRFAALVATRAELLACETIPCLAEVAALAQLIATYDVPAWISISARDGLHTCHGELISAVAQLVEGVSQVVAVGVNCTAPAYIVRLVEQLRAVTTKSIIVYPNSGEQYNANENSWNGATACTDFAGHAQAWYQAGARVIGGCCRTGPADIAAIAHWRQQLTV